MSSKSLAVVIPAFNSGEFIADTLESICKQTRSADAIIVVDDGSTDNTSEIVSSFGSRVRCIITDNRGQGCARALAINQTESDYIALCDSDDIWDPEHLQRRCKLFESYPDADFTFSDFRSFGPGATQNHTLLAEAPDGWMQRWCAEDAFGFYLTKSPYPAILEFNPAYVSGMVFRKSSYLRMGGFLDKYSRWIAEDSEFTRRFSSFPEHKFVGDRMQTWSYRRHPGNYSAKQWRNLNAKAEILEEHLRENLVPLEYQEATKIEIDKARCSAFDLSYWEKEKSMIDTLYKNLAPHHQTPKRMLKRLMGTNGIFI